MSPPERIDDQRYREELAAETGVSTLNTFNTSGTQDVDDPPVAGWPQPPSAAAYYSLAGDIVRTIEPHSEADPVGVLSQLLVMVGNAVGRGPYYRVGRIEHHVNEFAVIVGPTSSGRKGLAWGEARYVMGQLTDSWARTCIKSGLASGEGLISAVRDQIETRTPIREKGRVVDYENVVTDFGISDKRLLAFQAEFASVLRVMQRDSNTLSPTLRSAWDGDELLQNMTKNSPERATGAHISVLGHITPDELRRYLDRSELANGFANRIIFLCVRRTRCLPDGGSLDHQTHLIPLAHKLNTAIEHARQHITCMERDLDAAKLWHSVYPALTEGKDGLLGAITSRAEAHVLRLSCIYAILDHSSVVQKPHLEAALALWDYAERSAAFVFGELLGDPVADSLWVALKARSAGMSRNEMYDHFGGNRSREEISKALLRLSPRLRCEKTKTDGRPIERWHVLNVINVVSEPVKPVNTFITSPEQLDALHELPEPHREREPGEDDDIPF